MSEASVVEQADETPQEAAERLWKETGKDPLNFIKEFERWARQDADRVLEVLGPYWYRCVKMFLSRNKNAKGAWRYSESFRVMWRRLELRGHSAAVQKWYADFPLDPGLKKRWAREAWRRKAKGIKRVYADVDVKTGKLVGLIDKEFGPFAHIRVNNNPLAEVTTQEALAWCEKTDTDTRFVRALCQLIPDPRKPIGDQWTVEIIRQAKEAANASQGHQDD